MKAHKRHAAGWSLIELTIILVVLSILAAILAPVIGRYVRNAKVVRAREDIQAIGSAIWMFIEDTGNSFFMRDGTGDGDDGSPQRDDGVDGAGGAPDQDSSNRVDLLVSDGDIPEVATGEDEWIVDISAPAFDFLAYHLVTNNPGGSVANAYRVPSDLDNAAAGDPMFARDESGGLNSEFAWRGPYLTPPIDPDPWGNRYAVNVQFLDPQPTAGDADCEKDTIVLCAGPDEEVDTLWGVDGNTPGDDDIIYMLSANSNP